jgi:hypothetical protein
VAQTGTPGIHPGKLDGVKDQRSEREFGTRPSLDISM